METDLWKVFNFAERNPDQGGGILYCLRYSPERIEAHREAVISSLKTEGFTMQEADSGINVIPPYQLDEQKHKRLMLVLEELSVLNEAMEWVEGGFGAYNSLQQLSTSLQCAYWNFLKQHNKVDAYELVDRLIPHIIKDLKPLYQQKILSGKDRKTLEELAAFSERGCKLLTGVHQVTLFSSS